MGPCIIERVKRLAGNEIELGMEIPTIESRASNISLDKGNCIGITRILDIVVQPIKDLHGICGNQYGHPGLAIGY